MSDRSRRREITEAVLVQTAGTVTGGLVLYALAALGGVIRVEPSVVLRFGGTVVAMVGFVLLFWFISRATGRAIGAIAGSFALMIVGGVAAIVGTALGH